MYETSIPDFFNKSKYRWIRKLESDFHCMMACFYQIN